jgi:hypothetical protein
MSIIIIMLPVDPTHHCQRPRSLVRDQTWIERLIKTLLLLLQALWCCVLVVAVQTS